MPKSYGEIQIVKSIQPYLSLLFIFFFFFTIDTGTREQTGRNKEENKCKFHLKKIKNKRLLLLPRL